MRHDPGLAASPPVRYILEVERSGCSSFHSPSAAYDIQRSAWKGCSPKFAQDWSRWHPACGGKGQDPPEKSGRKEEDSDAPLHDAVRLHLGGLGDPHGQPGGQERRRARTVRDPGWAADRLVPELRRV